MPDNIHYPAEVIMKKLLETTRRNYDCYHASSLSSNRLTYELACELLGLDVESPEGKQVQEIFAQYATHIRDDRDDIVTSILDHMGNGTAP